MNLQMRNAVESDRQGISDVVIAAFGEEEGVELFVNIRDFQIKTNQ